MTRIEGTSSIYTPPTIRRAPRVGESSSASFSRHLAEANAMDGASGAQETSPLNSIAGVLGIQEVDDATSRASRGKKRALELLDKLDELKVAILSGEVSKDMLMRLAQMVHAKRYEVSDPKLAAILDEIDLRAQVELAKFERFSS